MKRVPRPNVRRRKGRAARRWAREAPARWRHTHRKARIRRFLKAAAPYLAQFIIDCDRIHTEEAERAFGPVTVSTRAMRIPFRINPPTPIRKETT